MIQDTQNLIKIFDNINWLQNLIVTGEFGCLWKLLFKDNYGQVDRRGNM